MLVIRTSSLVKSVLIIILDRVVLPLKEMVHDLEILLDFLHSCQKHRSALGLKGLASDITAAHGTPTFGGSFHVPAGARVKDESSSCPTAALGS